MKRRCRSMTVTWKQKPPPGREGHAGALCSGKDSVRQAFAWCRAKDPPEH